MQVGTLVGRMGVGLLFEEMHRWGGGSSLARMQEQIRRERGWTNWEEEEEVEEQESKQWEKEDEDESDIQHNEDAERRAKKMAR